MHTPSQSNVIPFVSRQQLETVRGLMDLANAARRGEIQGAAYTVIDRHGKTREGVVGAARTNRMLAHYGAARLVHRLLWPERYDTA